ncbi:MAG: ketol-acid reductoisomerase [Anaerolineae bacterium]|nr:ketol-acid reductoisomerase [Anaerolineae bacterium]MDW8068705.1 ketol-acid reductoisomerase [Anaerolineae bacterium]
MRIYRDEDARLELLLGKRIAVIGYGNQGRAQALNLRDSGLQVLIGNPEDAYAEQARADGFTVLPIAQAAEQGDVVMLLIPDEMAPRVFREAIAPALSPGDALVFASGFNVAFGFIEPPPGVDVILVAPRMIGAGVRDLYLAGRGFPSFIGVAQDASGHARDLALALAKGIGSTRAGVVEVTFTQEAELDLFTEQCFGPAFGQVLLTAVDLLVEEGYPVEAVLLELYMSGELAYTLGKMAEMGLIEQTSLHSRTSQYGSLSRSMRFMMPELRQRMRQGLEEIRSGQFAREWAAEQAAGYPTLQALREMARQQPIYRWEQELRRAMPYTPPPVVHLMEAGPEASAPRKAPPPRWKQAVHRLRRLLAGRMEEQADTSQMRPLYSAEVPLVVQAFLARLPGNPDLCAFAQNRDLIVHYVLEEPDLEFYLRFVDGEVVADTGAPPERAHLRLQTRADILDGILTGRIPAMRAAMSGQIRLEGDTRLAMSLPAIQDRLGQIYREVRQNVLSGQM